MKPLVKLVCASCETTVGKINRNNDGAMVRERTERTRYFEGGGASPHGFLSEGAVADRLVDKSEEVIDDPRAVRRSHEQAGDSDLFDHPVFAWRTICWKCTAAISIPLGGVCAALNEANEKQKVRRAVMHPLPNT